MIRKCHFMTHCLCKIWNLFEHCSDFTTLWKSNLFLSYRWWVQWRMYDKITFVTIHHQFDLSICGESWGLCGLNSRKKSEQMKAKGNKKAYLVDQVTSRSTNSSGGDLWKCLNCKSKFYLVTKFAWNSGHFRFRHSGKFSTSYAGSRKHKKFFSSRLSTEMEFFSRIFNFLTLCNPVICNFLNSLCRNSNAIWEIEFCDCGLRENEAWVFGVKMCSGC